MNNQISLEALKARLENINKEREALITLIAVYENQSPEELAIQGPSYPRTMPSSFSVRGRVVDAIIELIHKMGRQVSSKEILENLEERSISLGDTKNKESMLAAMLSQEVAKKSARLRKVARGVFDIKQ